MTDAAQAEVESLDRALDLFTEEAAIVFRVNVRQIMDGRGDLSIDDAATCIVGGMLAVLVQTCASAMPAGEDEDLGEHAARIVGFITDGLADAAPIFLGGDPEEEGES